MSDLVQVKADIPRHLKRRLFSEFALRDVRFNRWLTGQIEGWLAELEQQSTCQWQPLEGTHARSED